MIEPRTEAGRRVRDLLVHKKYGCPPNLDCDEVAQAALNRIETEPADAIDRTIQTALAEALEGELGTVLRTTKEVWADTARVLIAKMGIQGTYLENFLVDEKRISGVFIAVDLGPGSLPMSRVIVYETQALVPSWLDESVSQPPTDEESHDG